MLIDCDSCAARGPACADCVVTVLLGAPPARRFSDGSLDSGSDPGLEAGFDSGIDPELDFGIDLDGREQAAIAVLAGSGLVPPLRLVRAPDPVDKPDHLPMDGLGEGRDEGSGDGARRAAG
jgi:hypothetical protein